MISVREALASVLAELPRLGAEQVTITRARGRVLMETVRAQRDVPPFRNAALDGYALRAGDSVGASPTAPVVLRVLETVGAGVMPRQTVATGTATRIMTGAVVPEGADAVLRVEDTRGEGAMVEVQVPVRVGDAIRLPGEDLRAGEVVFTPGHELRPADIGLLASLGSAMVQVVRRPRVAVVTTGDELVEIGQPLGPGQIINSNAYALAAAIEEGGGTATVLGITRDLPGLLRAAFAEALRADMVLSTGGVSVGSFDFVRGTLQDLGYAERFWRVAQKPGKPLTFGLCEGIPVFGLPGNPVSSLVCFYVYVLPALRTMMGFQRVHLPSVEATLAERVRKTEGLTEFVRGVLEGPSEQSRVRSAGPQSSGILRSLSLSDGLIVGPPQTSVLEPGTRVRVILLKPDAGSSMPAIE